MRNQSLPPQLKAAKSNGWKAFRNIVGTLQRTSIAMHAKIMAIKTELVPAIRYGLEVLTPNGTAEKQALQEVDRILQVAMKKALNANTLSARRALKSNILQYDMCVPNVHTEMDSAHIRFADKQLARTTEGDCAGITECIRNEVLPNAPWSKRVAKAKRRVEDHIDLSTKKSNEEVNKALRNAHEAETYQNLGQMRKRRDCRLRAPTTTDPNTHIIDPYKLILARSEASNSHKQAYYMRFTSKVALPLAAARSAHLIDEACFESFDRDAGVCKLCEHATHAQSKDCSERERPWLELWHMLVDCRAPAQAGRRQCLHVLTDVINRMQKHADAADSIHVTKIMQILADVRVQMVTRRIISKRRMDTFLCFLTCPDSFEDPPASLKGQLTTLVAVYLRADLNELESTRKELDDAHVVEFTRNAEGHTDDTNARSRKRAREEQTQATSAANMRAVKQVRGASSNPPLYRSPGERVADVPPMG
ncbi:MAG: hypothetical protein WA948_12055 [Pontixanthobacter sp.]